MWGIWSDCSACAVAAGIPEAFTNRIGSPLSAAQPAAGIAYAALSADAITTSGLGLPGGGALEAVDRGGELVRAVARDRGAAQPLGRGNVADPDRLRAVGGARAGWGEQVERVGCGRRKQRAPRQQDRRPDRRRHQHRRGDRGLPVIGGCDRHGRRMRARSRRGEHGERDTGGVGYRVRAGHAGGVLGRQHREADAGGRGCRTGAGARGRGSHDQPGGTAAAGDHQHTGSEPHAQQRPSHGAGR